MTMAQESKKTIVKDEITRLQVEDSGNDQSPRELTAKEQVENFLQRKTAVTEGDLRSFQEYLNEKAKAAPASKGQSPRPTKLKDGPPRQMNFSRRGLLKVVAGSAIAGSAAVVAHSLVTNGSVSEQGAKH